MSASPADSTIRVSIDHYTKALHELERGPRSWQPTIDGLLWLARHGFSLNVAGRLYSGEAEGVVRAGYARLFASLGVVLDAFDPVDLVLFPEMDAQVDVPEITEACWGILGKSPERCHVRLLPDGGEAQGSRAAGRARLHAPRL